MGRKFWTGFVLSAAILWVLPAQATLLKYNLSGAQNFFFVLDTNQPIAGQSAEDGVTPGLFHAFYFQAIPNSSGNNPFPYLTFYDDTYGGGLSAGTGKDDDPANGIVYFDLVSTASPSVPLFTGSVTNPTLLTSGTFQLANLAGGGETTLTITAITASVPEPATWAMLILGFVGMVGWARVKRKTMSSIQP